MALITFHATEFVRDDQRMYDAQTIPNLHPTPAIDALPEWYKKANPYLDGAKKYKMEPSGAPNFTFKKCSPIFDSLSMGYFMYLTNDLYIDAQETNGWRVQWRSANAEQKVVTQHALNQVAQYPYDRQYFYDSVLKFENHLVIKTPRGYSCLFVAPMHRNDLPFTIVPGVVDTDRYKLPISFPFLLRETFTGMIPAGTPIVQVIPFRREAWKMKIGAPVDITQVRAQFFSIAHSFYRKRIWVRKQYRS